MSMVEEFAVFVSNHVSIKGYEFEHTFKTLCLKTASLRDEHLKFRALTATNTRENRRWYGLLFIDFEKGADYLVPSIHTNIVVITNLPIVHNLLKFYK